MAAARRGGRGVIILSPSSSSLSRRGGVIDCLLVVRDLQESLTVGREEREEAAESTRGFGEITTQRSRLTVDFQGAPSLVEFIQKMILCPGIKRIDVRFEIFTKGQYST